MFNINMRLSINSGRLERWLGVEKMEHLAGCMRHGGGINQRWYGPPINLRDVPGSVWVTGDGDFQGDFDRGFFDSALDSFERLAKRLWKEAGRQPEPILGAGFASLSDALGRASAGHRQYINGTVVKVGITGIATSVSSLWTAAGNPPAGAIGSAAPGGRALTKATTGAMQFNNPASGTLHLTGAQMFASVGANSLLLYDRLFDVAKNMNSSSAESVTGVPTRYQSSVVTNMDYAGGSFMFPETITTLAATGHNWDAMLYRNQAGTDAQAAPSAAGNSATLATRPDLLAPAWFIPLAAGDIGVMDLNSMKLSTAVATGTLDWVIGHPIGMLVFPILNQIYSHDWLTNMDQAPRIFDNAALAFLEMPKPSATATTYSGLIYATSAA